MLKQLNKAMDRANLVKVGVMVNGKTKQYPSHRWKSASEALNLVKKELRKESGVDADSFSFTNKKTNQTISEKDLIEEYKKYANNGGEETIQNYIKQNYRPSPKKTSDSKQPTVQSSPEPTTEKEVLEAPKPQYNEVEKVASYPNLEGSEKQIEWAERIREDLQKDVDKLKEEHQSVLETYPRPKDEKEQQKYDLAYQVVGRNLDNFANILQNILNTETDSKFFIDNRNNLIREYNEALRDYEKAVKYDFSYEFDENGKYKFDTIPRAFGDITNQYLKLMENLGEDITNKENTPEIDLPPLEGSEKQIPWGNDIRNQYVKRYYGFEILKDYDVLSMSENEYYDYHEVLRNSLRSSSVGQSKHVSDLQDTYDVSKSIKKYENKLEYKKLADIKIIEFALFRRDLHLEHNHAGQWINEEPLNKEQENRLLNFIDKQKAEMEEFKNILVKKEEEANKEAESKLPIVEKESLDRGLPIVKAKSVSDSVTATEYRNQLYDEFIQQEEYRKKNPLDPETEKELDRRAEFLTNQFETASALKWLKAGRLDNVNLNEFIKVAYPKEDFPEVNTGTTTAPQTQPKKQQHYRTKKSPKTKSNELLANSEKVFNKYKELNENPSSETSQATFKDVTDKVKEKVSKKDTEASKGVQIDMDQLYQQLKSGVSISQLMNNPNYSQALYLFLLGLEEDEDLLNSEIKNLI